MNCTDRVKALRRRLSEDGADAALVTMPSNLRYVTGFEDVIDEGINAAALVTSDVARFYTDSRYIEAARSAADGTLWETVLQRQDLYAEVVEEMTALSVRSVLMESEASYKRFREVETRLSGTLRGLDSYIEEIRRTKEPEEIACMAEAAAIADSAFYHMLGFIKAGMTEREIALELEFHMRRNGSEGMPFPPIVASGPQGARPHAIPGSREVVRGELIVLDFGARVRGYCSDMTRTIAVGKVGGRAARLYDAVLAANLAGLAAVRAGVPVLDVHAAAREVLAERGVAELFTHGLGHGVGLDVHELPIVGPRGIGVLMPGDAITIEPGVYVEGFAGVRIEDLVIVDSVGHQRLTNAPKELIEL